ncbi:MAG: aminoglycoside phosphotransferase family protein [Nocardioides sp.]
MAPTDRLGAEVPADSGGGSVGDPGGGAIDIPAELAGRESLGPEWAAWLGGLPGIARALLEEWRLTPTGRSMHGFVSLALPVVTESGHDAVLKIGVPSPEAEHEALALQHWAGNGAVRLLRADPHRFALLLERLHTRDLQEVWDLEACAIVAGLYRRLHVPAPPQMRRLSAVAERWSREFAAASTSGPVPRRLLQQAAGLARALTADASTDGTLIHTDLHYGNVLAADREPWLVIDPKPLSGDPHFELTPMLWNRAEDYAGDFRAAARRRFHTLVDDAELDEARARAWAIVRLVDLALDAEDDRDRATLCVSLIKAMQD